MSQIGGTIGGLIGNSQNPPFTSPGGVTPQEASLAQYDWGQWLLDALAQFEGTGQGGGPSLSTMATQAAGGANTGKALDLAKASDINQGAQYGAYQVADNIQASNQANQLQQISSLGKLASSALTPDAAGQGASTAAAGGTG